MLTDLLRATALIGLLAFHGCQSTRGPIDSADATIAITDVNVVDVSNGVILPGHTVVIAGERIVAVGPSGTSRPPRGIRVVDATGKYLIPGLWDMHVHAARAGRAPRFWPLFVAHGVTGVRETGSYLDSLVYWRDVSRVSADAPRIVWSSPMLDKAPPTYDHGIGISTVAEAREAVAQLERFGFDYLKIYSGLSRDVFFASADEARRRGIMIAGEVPDAVSPAEAAAAGMRSFEHLWNLFEACVPGAAALRDSVSRLEESGAPEHVQQDAQNARYQSWLQGTNAACVDSLTQRLHAAKVWQVPTLVVNRSYSKVDSTYVNDRNSCWVPINVLNDWIAMQAELVSEYGEKGIAAWRARYEHEAAMLRQMAEAGVGIMAGSDASDEPFVYAGASLHEELRLLVAAGLTPLQALQSATIGPATYLKRPDLGSIAPGSIADLVLLEANPLQDIGNTLTIRGVMLNGRYLDRRALDALLAGALPADVTDAAPGEASRPECAA